VVKKEFLEVAFRNENGRKIKMGHIGLCFLILRIE
jgi:hypothetical protein